MRNRDDHSTLWGTADGQFTTTHWSVVLTAGKDSSADAQTALARLCQTYWYPLYVYVRRYGHSREEAEDLTQEFFARLVGRHLLGGAKRECGKFRSYLLNALKWFLANEWHRERAQKRGGGQPLLSLDDVDAEARYALEPADPSSPDKAFERNWALTIMERALRKLSIEQAKNGKAALFEALQSCLMKDPDGPSYSELAGKLGMSQEALRMAASRLRRRYRKLLYQEVEQTVATPAEAEEEIRHLFAALAN